jgi:hypothetical protein
MRFEFDHDSQRYAVEVPDELFVTEPGQLAKDQTKPEHQKEEGWFKRQQLQRLESIAHAAITKGKPALWNGHLLTFEKIPPATA